VKQIQITMAESFGVQGRGRFYDSAGCIRDVIENHLMQVVGFRCMEPPYWPDMERVRDEQIKLFRSVRTLGPNDVVRGQFEGFLKEEGVAPNSQVETFAAVRLFIDNWRWQGVPIYLRAGKCMPMTATEVRVEFHRPPAVVFPNEQSLPHNYWRFLFSPRIEVGLNIQVKADGERMVGQDLELMAVDQSPDEMTPYERLIGDALRGDCLIVVGRGLGVRGVLARYLRLHCGSGRLLLVLEGKARSLYLAQRGIVAEGEEEAAHALARQYAAELQALEAGAPEAPPRSGDAEGWVPLADVTNVAMARRLPSSANTRTTPAWLVAPVVRASALTSPAMAKSPATPLPPPSLLSSTTPPRAFPSDVALANRSTLPATLPLAPRTDSPTEPAVASPLAPAVCPAPPFPLRALASRSALAMVKLPAGPCVLPAMPTDTKPPCADPPTPPSVTSSPPVPPSAKTLA
jgi:hypothetical protein